MKSFIRRKQGDSNTTFVMVVLVLAVMYALYPAPFNHGFRWIVDATFTSLEASTGNKISERPVPRPADGYTPKAPTVKEDKTPPAKTTPSKTPAKEEPEKK